jgi:hypothetical protein
MSLKFEDILDLELATICFFIGQAVLRAAWRARDASCPLSGYLK